MTFITYLGFVLGCFDCVYNCAVVPFIWKCLHSSMNPILEFIGVRRASTLKRTTVWMHLTQGHQNPRGLGSNTPNLTCEETWLIWHLNKNKSQTLWISFWMDFSGCLSHVSIFKQSKLNYWLQTMSIWLELFIIYGLEECLWFIKIRCAPLCACACECVCLCVCSTQFDC